ncbi:MAG: glycosyltransferase N-terminal domain-containing protein, partial [Gammaproteobacteria bacterium]
MTWLRTLWPSGFWSALGYLVLPIAGLWQGTGFSNPFQRWRARQRLTLYQPSGIEPLRHHPVLWIHAAALGEWLALRPLLQRIKADHPKLRIFATASAREVHSTIARFGEIDVVGCLPLDCSALCRRALGVIRPACIMLAETEIWPNFIATAAARGIPLALVNARLDDCAFRHYQLLRPLFAPILEHYQTVVAQSARDHARFQALGVAATSLHISGNLKRDAALRRADTASATRWRA